MQPYQQPSKAPVPKVQAVGVTGLILTAVVVVASALGVQLPVNFQDNITQILAGGVALVSLVHFAAAYFTHDKKPAVAAVTPAASPGAQLPPKV